MRAAKRKSYRRLLQELREACPPIVPVKTRRRILKGMHAYTNLVCDEEGRPSHFWVVLDSRLSWEAVQLALLHEWAHTMSWGVNHPTIADHGVEFGIAYSRVWSAIIDP